MRRLGVTQRDLEQAPKISEMLSRAYGRTGLEGRYIPGNPFKAVDDLRFSPDPIAQRFLAVYDKIPVSDRERLSIEAICIKAEVSPQEFLGHAFLMRQSLSKAESSLVAINAFPDIVRSMVAFAELPEGIQDRKVLAQHPAIGFLPSPKGAVVNLNLWDKESDGPEEEDTDDDAAFNATFSGKTADLETWANNRRLLLEGKK